ncbi:hypothetical protein M8994_16315 [Brucella sp. 21LCYQ03]|nr:hypothetical protein [Brucella sp. 21LCYQ03]
MHDYSLKGLVVLIAEDEYMIAAELERELERAGATVLGPVSSLDRLLDLIKTEGDIDAAPSAFRDKSYIKPRRFYSDKAYRSCFQPGMMRQSYLQT